VAAWQVALHIIEAIAMPFTINANQEMACPSRHPDNGLFIDPHKTRRIFYIKFGFDEFINVIERH
jgi:hypothetical protein